MSARRVRSGLPRLPRQQLLLASALATIVAGSALVAAELTPEARRDWQTWRGPNGNNVAIGSGYARKWSATENVIWKANVPGRGHSSPTVVGGRIYLTTADEKNKVQSLLAYDRETGELLWKKDLHQGSLPSKIHNKNTHATPTVASDGERLFVAFFHDDHIQLTALDLDGQQQWECNAGTFRPRTYQYGYAPSPAIHGDRVIVCGDYDGGGFIVALDRATGTEAWRADRPGQISYSSPIVARVGGREQLLLSGCKMVAGYDPANGKQLWQATATTMATCGTIVWDGNMVFASGGYPDAETAGVRADGSGKVVWTNRTKCYEQSMLAHEGHVYAFDDQGMVFCWQASNGKERWKHRLKGPVSSSPILADGVIYAANELGTWYVFKANPAKFELLAENQLGTDAFATPAFCDGRVFIRAGNGQDTARQEILYAIGEAR